MNKVEEMERALDLALSLLDLKEGEAYKTVRQQDIDAIKAARAMPKRQCDVGTAEEQTERFKLFCHRRECVTCELNRRCPFRFGCFSVWAQMPYEADAEKKERNDDAE